MFRLRYRDAGAGKEDAPRSRWNSSARPPHENPKPEFGFESADLLRQRRLRHAETRGCFRKASLVRDGQDLAKHAQVSFHTYLI